MKNNKFKGLIIAGIILIAVAILVYAQPWQGQVDAETKAWEFTLVGRDGTQKVLSYEDITKLPAYKGNGGFFSTVGIVYGPYKTQGVLLTDLCELVGGIEPGDTLMISAKDGYSSVFDYDQVMGDFITYTTDLKEAPHDELKTILMYEQDGKPLSDDDGKPLRIAVVGTKEGLLTEGSYWVKWVSKIEVLTP